MTEHPAIESAADDIIKTIVDLPLPDPDGFSVITVTEEDLHEAICARLKSFVPPLRLVAPPEQEPIGYVTGSNLRAMKDGLQGVMTVSNVKNAVFQNPLFASPVAHPLRDGEIYATVSKRQFSEEENAAIDQDIAGKLSAGYAELIRELVGALKRIERWHGEFPETGEYWDKEKTQMMSYAACFGSNGERDFMRNIARSSIARAEAEGFGGTP
jgi:hypothetical protein